MFDNIEIIIYIIFVVVGIITQSRKNKKAKEARKAKRRRAQQPQKQPTPSPVTVAEPAQPVNEPQTFDLDDIFKEFVPDIVKNNPEKAEFNVEDDVNPYMELQHDVGKKKRTTKPMASNEAVKEELDGFELGNFDLKEAVIQSAILNRKF